MRKTRHGMAELLYADTEERLIVLWLEDEKNE